MLAACAFCLRAAANQLSESDPAATETARENEARDLLRESLLDAIRVDFARHRGSLPELGGLLETPEDRALLARLIADGYHAMGDIPRALEAYRSILESVEKSDPLVERDPHWKVRDGQWVRGRLRRLWQHAAEIGDTQGVGEIEREIRAWLKNAERRGFEAHVAAIQSLGDVPPSDTAHLALAEQWRCRAQYLAAVRAWEQVARGGSAAARQEALARLVVVYRELDRPWDAATRLELLAQEYPNAPCFEGKTPAEYIRSLDHDDPLHRVLAGVDAWPKGAVRVEVLRQTTLAPRRQVYLPPADRAGLVPTMSPLVYDGEQELLIYRAPGGGAAWSVSLAEESDARFGFNYDPLMRYYQSDAGVLIVSAGLKRFALDVLAGGSPAAPRLMWREHFLQGRRDRSVSLHKRTLPAAERPWGAHPASVWDPLGIIAGPGLVVGDKWIACRRLGVEARDLTTHDLLWRRSSVAAGSRLFGDDDYLFVVSPDSDKAVVLDPASGEWLGERRIGPEEGRVAQLGRHVLSWKEESDAVRLAQIDAWTGEERWNHQVGLGARLGLLPGGDELAIADPQGRLLLIDVLRGTILREERWTPAGTPRDVTYWRLGRRRVVSVSRDDGASNGRSDPGSRASALESVVMGFDLGPEGSVWRTTLRGAGYLPYYPPLLPVMVFAVRASSGLERGDGTRQEQLAISVLDVRDGRVLAQMDDLPGDPRYVEIQGDPRVGTVAVATRSARVELHFQESP